MTVIFLEREQARQVTVDHIASTMILMKQYMDDTQIAKYKFMLREFADLKELQSIAKRFDEAHPSDVKWS